MIGHAFAADNQGVGQLQVFAVLDKVLRDLQRKLPRRFQDQATRHAGPGAGTGENIQHRQGKAGCLAGAGLRYAQHVPAHQDEGNRLFLDWCRMAVSHVVDRPQHGLRQPQVGEHRPRDLGRRDFASNARLLARHDLRVSVAGVGARISGFELLFSSGRGHRRRGIGAIGPERVRDGILSGRVIGGRLLAPGRRGRGNVRIRFQRG